MVAVAMEATERTVKICVPFFCKVPWEKLLHLLGRPQGGRASNLPSVNMARSCLSLPEFLKQSGSRYVCSSTAGKGVKAPPRWTALGQPHTSPPMQGGGTAPQAKVQHLSQNGYSLALSLSLSLSGVPSSRVSLCMEDRHCIMGQSHPEKQAPFQLLQGPPVSH